MTACALNWLVAVQGASISKLWWEIHKQVMAGNSTFLWFLCLTTNVIASFISCVLCSIKCNLVICYIQSKDWPGRMVKWGVSRMALEGHSLSVILKFSACLKETYVGDIGCLPANMGSANGGIYWAWGCAWLGNELWYLTYCRNSYAWEWCGLPWWKATAAWGRCWSRGSARDRCDCCSCGCWGLAGNEMTQDLLDVS